MRLMGPVFVVMSVAAPSADAACVDDFDEIFKAGPTVEAVPPSELTLGSMFIQRTPEPPKGVVEECSPSTTITLEVLATDDTTPRDRIGFRVRIRNDLVENIGAQIPNPTGSELGLLRIRFRGRDVVLDFDLGLSAIDESGNVGPETVIPIFDEPRGCNGGGSWSLLPGVALLGLHRRRS